MFEIPQGGTITAERIAIAVVAGKPSPVETAYAAFDRGLVAALGIQIIKEDGGTIDSDVNAVHYDLRVGSAEKLLQLAGVIARGEIVPILKSRVEQLLRAGFESGHLDHTKNPALRDRVKAQVAIPVRIDDPRSAR